MKNCLSCKYEPDWESYRTLFIGDCKWFEFNTLPACVDLYRDGTGIRKMIRKNPDGSLIWNGSMDCETWEEK